VTRRTKIIATLGPASRTDQVIGELIARGVDVFRLNFSHGTQEQHGAVVERVRAAAERAGRVVAILQDLSGPKIRTGSLRGGTPLRLEPGAPLRIVVGDQVGESGVVSTTYADLPRAVHAGDCLLLDDGRIELRVEDSARDEISTVVVDGGELGEHKGINVPGVELPTTGLTEKDLLDLRFGLAAGVDFVALSFVQSAEVLRQARAEAHRAGTPDVPLVAKLERPEAINRLEEILAESDAVMVARGDLGLELPLERVPGIQKEVTRRARTQEIPVIVATQVLDSMRTELRPTRAEVSDAANAVDDGVDAIMLAGETAAGAHPVRVVQVLDAVIREAESIPSVRVDPVRSRQRGGHLHAVCEAAVTLAAHGDARAIVAVTRRGTTARMLAAFRPQVPVLAVTGRAEVARRLAMLWGVVPVLAEVKGELAASAERIGAALVERGTLPAGSVVVLVRVSPDLTEDASNFVKLHRV